MQKSTLKEYWHIFYHSLAASALGLIMQLTDTYFISQIGSEQLAAMGLAMSFSIFVWAFLGSLVGASQVNISKAFGANLKKRLRAKIFVGTVFVFSIALPLYFIMNIGSPILFSIFSAENEVMSYAAEYYHIWIISILIFPFASMYSGTLNKVNLNKYTTMIMGLGIVLNIILDYVMIFGYKDIIEPMGIKGAAWATVISSIITTALYWLVLHKRGYIIYKMSSKKKFVYLLKRLVKLGKHYALSGLMMPIAYLSIMAGASHLQTNILAAYTVVDRMWMIYFTVMGAAGTAMDTLVTRYHGAKKRKKGREVFIFKQKIELFWTLGLLMANYFFGDQLGAIFLKTKEQIEIFKYSLYIMTVFWSLWGFQGSINHLFMNLDKPHLATKTIFARNIGLITLPYLGATIYGLNAFLYAQALVAAVVLVWVLHLYIKHMADYFNH